MFAGREGVRAQGQVQAGTQKMEGWFHTELVLLGKFNRPQFHPAPALRDQYDGLVEMNVLCGSTLTNQVHCSTLFLKGWSSEPPSDHLQTSPP